MKKGQGGLSSVPIAVITFVIVAIVLGVGATLLTDVQADQITGAAGCNSSDKSLCGFDYNASEGGLQSLDTFSSWQDNIALIAVFGVILTLLGGFLFFKGRN